jgi:hypothetical protein
MIQFYKINNDINKVNWIRPLLPCHSLLQSGPAQGIRGYKRRLSGQWSSSCVKRENFFANQAVNEWNKLPATTISAETVNQFKNQYDKWKVSGNPA